MSSTEYSSSDAVPATDADGEPTRLGTFGGMDIYPMPMFALIEADDVAGVSAWYQAALGFALVFSAPPVGGQPSLVHLRRLRYQDVLIAQAGSRPGPDPGPARLQLSFNADGEVDALAALAAGAAACGSSAVAAPVDTPWNTRDLRVTDPCGNRLVFTGRQANPDPEAVARFRSMFERSEIR